MELKDIRGRIDKVDQELVSLLKARMALCAEVAGYKKEQGLPILDREREREVVYQAAKQAGPELESCVRLLYNLIFDASRGYQARLNGAGAQGGLQERLEAAIKPEGTAFPSGALVACQGTEGAYSQKAAEKLFAAPNILYFRTFEGVFQAVQSGLCEYGVLPIENSSAGSVLSVYDLMDQNACHIVRSTRLHIHHQLMAKPGAAPDEVREVYSHEQALRQCSLFFEKHAALRPVECENTAIAAKTVAERGRNDIAAICSPDCAALYGLTVLDDHVQNNSNNYTRFICIEKALSIYPGADRISISLSVSHTPGALYQMIAKFAVLGLNLTKIESRPIPGSDFDFLFYVDVTASVWNENVRDLLLELSVPGNRFTLLGCYREV